MKFILILFVFLFPGFSVFAQNETPANKYYSLISKALLAHYVDHNVDSSLFYLLEADKVFPNSMNGDYLLIAKLFAQKNDTKNSLKFLKKAAVTRNINTDWDDACWKTMKQSMEFKVAVKNINSFDSFNKQHFDIDLISIVNYAIGSDQFVRDLKREKYELSDTNWSRIMHKNDSANYQLLKEYFEEVKPSNLSYLLNIESYNYVLVLFNHFIMMGLDEQNNDFFRKFIIQEVEKGLFDNTLLPYLEDYNSSSKDGFQTYGYSTRKNNSEKLVYAVPFKNISKVDSLRAARGLPPLIIDIIVNEIIPPEDYKFQKN